MFLDQLAQLVSVKPRHVDVHQNQRRIVSGDLFYGCHAVERGHDPVASFFQRNRDEFSDDRAVIDDQHSFLIQ